MDAMVDLIAAGDTNPSTEALAERAGVSVSSVFRYFDGLGDLRDQTIDHYFERYQPLFAIPDIGDGPLDDRVERFARARVHLYEVICPIARLARARAFDHERMADALARARATFLTQVEEHFATELDRMDPARHDGVAASIDSLTSFESWDIQHRGHGRSLDQVRASWIDALTHLLAT